MARVYYKEEKLSGEPLHNKFINVDLFDYIFNSTNTNKFQLTATPKNPILKTLKIQKEVFNNIQLTRDGIDYSAEEGNFYLPNSIIFYDVEDAVFPSEFYFISKIGDQIELRQCDAGEGVKWYQIPVLHKTVEDKKVLSKVKNSLKKVKKLVDTTYNKKVEEERAQKELERKRKIEEMRPLLNQEQKSGYLELTNLCVNNEASKHKITHFIETLKNYDEDEEYLTTLNYFLEFLDKDVYNFIMRLDWKSDIEDFERMLKAALKDNYDEVLKLPDYQSYDENASVSNDGIFEAYIKPVRLIGLQVGFIDTQSDEYILLLHKQEDTEQIKEAVHKIGYAYYNKN